MSRNETEEYKKRLRKIILNSADVLPEKVVDYLQKVKKNGYHDAIEQVKNGFAPLAVNLAAEYVDFFLDTTVRKKPKGTRHFAFGEFGTDEFEERELGIGGSLDYFPASPIQGPFLGLLNRNENEGLRLIQTLTNTAVARWRKRYVRWHSNNKPLTLLPFEVELATGIYQYWGDAQVYSWFRPTHNAPSAIESALMALEMWMERQIEAGRDAQELFNKVLSGSECVAIPGICIAMTLAYPQKCLEVALPLISQPAFWRMDIARYSLDSSQLKYSEDFSLNRHAHHHAAINERNQRPQRKTEIRHLAAHYLFMSSDELREKFKQAVARFSENLPFFTEEEKLNPESVEALRENVELHQTYGEPENRRFYKGENGHVYSYFEHPERIKERLTSENQYFNLQSRYLGLWLWSTNSLKENRLFDSMTVDQAYAAAQEFRQKDDFNEPLNLSNFDNRRLEGIIGVAAAILMLGSDWLKQQPDNGAEAIAWCRRIILQAASVPVQSDYDSRDSKFPVHPKAIAALGLGSLVASGLADEEIKREIIRLAGDYHVQVATSVFRALSGKAWCVEPALCWNALSLTIKASLVPKSKRKFSISNFKDDTYEAKIKREKKRVIKLINQHLDFLAQGISPDLPKIPARQNADLLWDLTGGVLLQLPLGELCQDADAKNKLLLLLDGLLKWTVEANSPDENGRESHHYYEWNDALFKWVARLSAFLKYEEIQNHLFVLLKDNYAKVPNLTAEFLQEYAFARLDSFEPLPSEAVKGWKEMCQWVLDARKNQQAQNQRPINDWDSLNAVIFMTSWGCFWNERWNQAAAFTDVINEWIELVGHEPRRFSRFLIMLDVLWNYFDARQIIIWFENTTDSATNLKKFWQTDDNGNCTAVLLQKLWQKSSEEISEPASLKRYSKIVDSLVNFGVPLASVLQKELENRESNLK